MIDIYNGIYLKCPWWFNIYIPYEMITTTRLILIPITLHNYLLCVCMLNMPKIYSFSKFQVYKTASEYYNL